MMYELTLNNSSISLFDILHNKLLKFNFLKNKEILENPFFLYIIKNLDIKKLDLFKNYNIEELIENCRSAIDVEISLQIEDDLIKKLDLLRILYSLKIIDLQKLISNLLEIENFLHKNLEINPIIILKFIFILVRLGDIDYKNIFLKLEDFYQYYSMKIKKIQINSSLSKSNIYKYIIYLLNNYLLEILLKTKIQNDFYIIKTRELIKEISAKKIFDYEFAEILSYNLKYLEKKLKLNKEDFLMYLKSTILEFFSDLFKLDRFSIDNFLKIFTILINLKIAKIRLSFQTCVENENNDEKILRYYPTDRIIFFEDLQKSQFPSKIKEFIEQLEICFNNKCYRACQFYIRLIIETALYLKAKMANQLNKLKRDDEKFKNLKEWPDIAFKLNFITQNQVKKVKRLIEYGDIGVHNFRVPPNKDNLIKKIEILREILYNIFFNS